jgi:hypothetical protein
MVRRLLFGWWYDDRGAVFASEFLFLVTLLVIGSIVGLTNVRDAVNIELSETSNAILALSQGYIISGQQGCCSFTDGSAAIDTPGTLPQPTCVAPAIPSVIDVGSCQN